MSDSTSKLLRLLSKFESLCAESAGFRATISSLSARVDALEQAFSSVPAASASNVPIATGVFFNVSEVISTELPTKFPAHLRLSKSSRRRLFLDSLLSLGPLVEAVSHVSKFRRFRPQRPVPASAFVLERPSSALKLAPLLFLVTLLQLRVSFVVFVSWPSSSFLIHECAYSRVCFFGGSCLSFSLLTDPPP
eukprot:GILI01002892.1.p1 GENE.GILI01002892.1~~GILI01002892.1.p1  ORF type:complete len:192 (-),score=20.81 GILI01002892.1:128-703(-)